MLDVPQTGFALPLLLDLRREPFLAENLSRLLRDPRSRLDVANENQAAGFGDPDARDDRPFDFRGGIAYIPIRGPLFNDEIIDRHWGWSGYKGIAHQVAAAMGDDEVQAILFDIRSPGGTASGLFDLVDEIHAARGQGKIIWTMANDTATSAAYAIASAADRLFLPRLGSVGSIGVWTLHADFSQMLEQDGIKFTLIFAGKHKVDGHPFAPLPDDVRARIQSDVDHVQGIFVDTVARNRGLAADAVRNTEARIFDDRDAVAAGLADGIATDKEVVGALIEELGGAIAA